jgi:hypothetical protein
VARGRGEGVRISAFADPSMHRARGSARRPCLVLCDARDEAGPWLRDGLTARGIDVRLTPIEELLIDARWQHWVRTGPEAGFTIGLPGGHEIASARVGSLINRLRTIPDAFLAQVVSRDRAYVEQEWRALLCSALSALTAAGIPVLPAPHPYSLSGRWRSVPEWATLAARAGLTMRPWRWASDFPPANASKDPVTPVLVFGSQVVSQVPLPPGIADGCQALCALSEAGMLQLDLELTADDAYLVAAGPVVDPRVGGEAALDALAGVVA